MKHFLETTCILQASSKRMLFVFTKNNNRHMKKLSTVLAILMIPFFVVPAMAQFEPDTVEQELKPWKKRRMAKKLYKIGSYYNSLEYYEQYYEAKPDKSKTIKKIADLNYFLRDYKAAEKWYKILVDTYSEDYPKSRYWYALMQKYNAKYDEAKQNFTTFMNSYLADDSEEFNKLAAKHIEGCDLATELMKNPVRSEIEHLDENINNPFTDFAPGAFENEVLYFSTLRSDSVLDVKALRGVDYYSKVYTSTKKDGQWQPATPLEGPVNSTKFHTGNTAFNADKTKMYFTRCWTTRKMKTRCEIFVSKYEDGTWGEPEVLGNEINARKTTNTHPTVGMTVEKKEVLYFVSDREGGIGGMDIWYAVSNGEEGYEVPVNLGTNINTSSDEITPHYDNANGKLYFSSNGLINIGGFDVFVSEGSESSWGEASNVGYPLNASTDDMYYSTDADEKNGFFVSNRPGVFSLKSETCCDDIFQYTLIKEVVLEGFVATKSNPETPIGDADLSFFTVHGETLALISTFKTNEQEHFLVPLDPEKVYQVNATKSGYWGSEKVIDLSKLDVKDTLKMTFFLEEIVRKKIKLRRIYYNFDKYNLTRQYKQSLDSLYNILIDNESFTLEIIGHTDAIGSDKYNEELSRRRAESAADYLMQKGIDKNRLSLVAKGESDPIAPNTKENGADNPQGRAKNRRVQFKLNTNDPNLEIEIEYEDTERKDTK